MFPGLIEESFGGFLGPISASQALDLQEANILTFTWLLGFELKSSGLAAHTHQNISPERLKVLKNKESLIVLLCGNEGFTCRQRPILPVEAIRETSKNAITTASLWIKRTEHTGLLQCKLRDPPPPVT